MAKENGREGKVPPLSVLKETKRQDFSQTFIALLACEFNLSGGGEMKSQL